MRVYNVPHGHPTQGASAASCLAALSLHEIDRDMRGTLVPRMETQIVVRFGSMARGGLDAHVLGARQQVHRKLVFGGQRIVVARLRLGTHEAVLGAPASAIAGHTIALEDLWGDSARLFDRFVDARNMAEAAAALEGAISERIGTAQERNVHPRFALEAARRLQSASVDVVAADLGVSARHLRRVFREALGTSPKAFARLTRFHRALRDARQDGRVDWAGIAAAAGYYDQAHLIAEFRAIAGVTPRALVDELRAGPGID
ncbi:AraC-like DNA-binding protein [Variovorax sp. SG517]|uniref:helix-turn-helix domain-containing protein n=1 Tax=Variovorax sp. SG517 TaxID=2587117 RepID=UPI00159DD9B5|nr:helix-turn-helix domain-containing protein [Variovorax sp. SG517]NVM90157.1 AraC-like DNA-binding protein [Variovorax sp. SG517]